MAPSSFYFCNLFHLFSKRVDKTIDLLQKFPNVLPRTSKLFVRPQSQQPKRVISVLISATYIDIMLHIFCLF